jgi:Isopropylmalate/homocitrate/citramalate synthases
MIDQVRIFDTTLRDGEQAARINLNKGEKLRSPASLPGLVLMS